MAKKVTLKAKNFSPRVRWATMPKSEAIKMQVTRQSNKKYWWESAVFKRLWL